MIAQLIWEGLGYGLLLTIMIGPIFVTLTQAGIERGFRAGATVGLGIWISDILIVAGGVWLFKKMGITELSEQFQLYMGVIGGIILIAFGLGSMLKKITELQPQEKLSARSFFGYLSKGFLVNTINPFTFTFWLSLITIYVVTRGLSMSMTALFFGSIIGTIIVTDTLKVVMAKALRKKLHKDNLNLLNKIAGAGLLISGIVLILRVL